jgi:hypothetical protein
MTIEVKRVDQLTPVLLFSMITYGVKPCYSYLSLTPNAHIIFFTKNAKDLAMKMMMFLFKLHLKI